MLVTGLEYAREPHCCSFATHFCQPAELLDCIPVGCSPLLLLFLLLHERRFSLLPFSSLQLPAQQCTYKQQAVMPFK
jgi:hypothetical protein